MNPKSNSTWILLAFALLASLWFSEAQAAEDSFEQTLDVDEPVVLDVSTGSGSITVQSGPAGRVEIVGHVKVGTSLFRRSGESAQELVDEILANPPIEMVDGTLKVGHRKGRNYKGNVSISYEITVPADTRVKSRTGSGSTKIDGVAEVLKASSGSGSVEVGNIAGPAKATTGSGRIRLDGVAGAVAANTGSGRITVFQTAPGDVKASTGSGGIELHGIDGAIDVSSGSGGVEVDGRQAGTWIIDTGSGSIRVDLPDDAAFELDAESNSGSIVVDFPVTVQGKISKRHLRGEVRGGGDLLRIDSGSGGIKVY
ncbi:MAG: DUF4097 domain-containing protein [Gammaproteobacteria bacterium]|nr:DUF4097 domain-containing protein [Gammaproteobacteria bacterium]